MSTPFLPAERAQFSAIIDGILASSDLRTISPKQIQKGLSERLGIDLADKKAAVKALIIERFDRAYDPEPTPEHTSAPDTLGHIPVKAEKIKSEHGLSSSASTLDIFTPVSTKQESELEEEDISPPKKKRKVNKAVDDAKLAAILQAQENSRARPTRGGVTKKVIRKKAPRKKSEKKVKEADDSDLELDSNGEVKEKPKKGGFHKQYHLSAPLAELVGEPTLSRPQVVKKIWVHIKANGLQDPSDKRQIICDAKMQSVFKQDKVHMFTMNKLLGKQLYDAEE